MNKTDVEVMLGGLNELLAASKPKASTARGWRIIREIRDAIADMELPDERPALTAVARELQAKAESERELSPFIPEDEIE
jgi:hypothetical protein